MTKTIYVGSDIREGTCFPGKLTWSKLSLIKVGKKFLRNSCQQATTTSHWIENNSLL